MGIRSRLTMGTMRSAEIQHQATLTPADHMVSTYVRADIRNFWDYRQN